MLQALRPGTGIPPSRIGELTGRRLVRPLRSGELLRLADVE
jgi:sialic acid synthase SpsE